MTLYRLWLLIVCAVRGHNRRRGAYLAYEPDYCNRCGKEF